MRSRTRDPGNLAGGIAFVALGGWLLQGAEGFSPLGAIFPRVVGIAMVALALLLLVLELLGRSPAAMEEPAGGSMRRRLALIVVMAAWALAMPVVGFIASGVSAFAAITLLVPVEGRRTGTRILRDVGVGVAIVVGFHLLLTRGLDVPLPRGVIPF